MTSFQVNATSAAVSGAPSLQRKFLRSLNVQVLPSGELVQDAARPGSTRCVGTSKPSNDANMNRRISCEEVSLAVMGLKVLGSPSSVITNRPPGMPGGQAATSGGSGRG